MKKDPTGDLIFTLAAAFASTMPKHVGDRLASSLAALGYDAEVIPNCLKGLNGLHETFESLMGLPEPPLDPAAVTAEFEAQ
jgi:hypothetical protein